MHTRSIALSDGLVHYVNESDSIAQDLYHVTINNRRISGTLSGWSQNKGRNVTFNLQIGDSSTNVISPLMSYLGVIVIFGQKYKKDFGVGNLISIMMPISMVFLFGWTIFAIIWALLGLPIGPGTTMFM